MPCIGYIKVTYCALHSVICWINIYIIEIIKAMFTLGVFLKLPASVLHYNPME